MSFEETHAKKLPPFGIKDLYGPSNPPAILHISGPQYDSTIRSYPDATLTYLDEDDGETILVGSGVELQQRLEEPVRLARLSRATISSPSRRTSFDDRLIHLFDIQHTANSHVVWKEHEAYSSKTLRDRSSSSVSHEDGESSPARTEQIGQATDLITYPAVSAREPIVSRVPQAGDDSISRPPAESFVQEPSCQTPHQSAISNDPLRELMDKNIGIFADFLDSAAQVLRKVAQKTREADASPVESMLNGLKDVLSEVGELGMEVVNGLDYERIPTARNDAAIPPSEDLSNASAVAEAAPQSSSNPVPYLSKRVSFADMKLEEGQTACPTTSALSDCKDGSEKLSPGNAPNVEDESPRCIMPVLNDLDKAARSWGKSPAQDVPQHWSQPVEQTIPDPPVVIPGYSYQRNTAAATSAPRYLPYRSFPNRPGPMGSDLAARPGPSTSIMDLETSNPDFAARYPPLMSLRRAKTVSDLQKRDDRAQGLMTTRAALNRYPSIGQLWDAHGRPEYPYRKPRGRRGLAKAREATDARVRDINASPVSPIDASVDMDSQASKRRYISPSVEDEFVDTKKEAVRKTLPGSWPEPKTEDMSALPVTNESSGAFFNRMTGLKEPKHVTTGIPSPALSCRNTGPPEDPFWPSSNLRRANTVTASNPAARLTKPFDPLIGASKPLFPRGEGSTFNKDQATSSIPKRSLTQREPPRTQPNPNGSTIGGPNPWTNFQRPAQLPMMPPARPPPPFQMQTAPQHPGWTPTWGPSVEELRATSEGVHSPTRWPADEPQYSAEMTAEEKINVCVKTLRMIGYGEKDLNERARLGVYAGAASGDLLEAVDMIEEDRKVAAAMDRGVGTIRTL